MNKKSPRVLRHLFVTTLLVIIVDVNAAPSASAEAPKKRIIFLAGAPSHGPGQHEYRAGCLLLAKALNEQSGLPVKAEVISGWPADESVLQGASEIVFYDSATKVIGKNWEKVDALAKAGTGLTFLHYAVHPSADMGEKYYRPWMGGAFESGFSVNPFWVADLQPLPSHPVSRGIAAPVRAYDEFYYNMRFRQDRASVFDLATATPTRENVVAVNNLWTQEGFDGLGKPQTLMWGTEREGGGRGVGFSGGHYHRNWAIDGYRKLVLNAIVWGAGMEVPADGVKSLPLSQEDLNANLDAKGRNAAPLTLPQPNEFAELKHRPVPTVAEHKAAMASKKADKTANDADSDETKGKKEKTTPKPKDESQKPEPAPPGEPKAGAGGETIDLNVDPEVAILVAEFEGFLAYGNPLPELALAASGGSGKSEESASSVPRVASPQGSSSGSGKPEKPEKPAARQTTGEKEVSGESTEKFVPPSAFTVPDDLEVTLWAASPMLLNPTNMDTDREGRIWVAEGVDYRRKKDRRPEGDRIMVLEDTDHDGKADRSHVFVQDPELVSPLGISVFGNKIVVAQPPNLIVYTDVDGDLHFDPKIDKRENLLSGFMGFNHDHSLHAVVGGPDGRWYFNHGNTGAEFTTRDGVTYRIGGPYGPGEKIAGSKSDDGRVYTGGFAASMNPDGTKLRMIGHGFRNSYEHCVTSLGDVFQNDNDDPPACRTTWLMEGGFLGFFSRSGKRTWEADRRRGQSVPTAEWRQEDPGTLPPGDVYGRGAPTGIAYYENGALPEKYRGLLLSGESRLQTIYGYYPKTEDAGKKLERFEFLKTAVNTQFRPSDVMVGADGAIYVADWYDSHVGGHGTFDDSCSGAIYRIAPKGFRPAIPKAETTKDGALTPNGALTLLQNPAPNVRFEGFMALKQLALSNPAKVLKLIEPLLTRHPNADLRARAAWLLPYLGEEGLTKCRALLASKDADERILGLRVLRNGGFDLVGHPEVITAAVQDSNVAVRREAAVLLRELPGDFRLPLVEQLLASYNGQDRTFLEACGLAAEGIEDKVWSMVQGRLKQNNPLQWSAAFARITWRLQPPSAVPLLLQRANSTTLPFEDRKLAVDTIAFTRAESAVSAMQQLRHSEPIISELATAWLLTRATDEWDSLGGRKVLKDEGLYDPDKVVIQEVKMPETPAKNTLPSPREIMALKGDAAAGKVVAARCTMCHRIGDAGVEYGPDLAGWAANQGVETFLRSVLDPSESIALGFEGQRVPLKDGREVQGILISAGDPITVRSTGGVTQMIPRAMLDKRTVPLRRSLMLSAQELGLTAQELADLAAFMVGYK